jgi:hypothetical protein
MLFREEGDRKERKEGEEICDAENGQPEDHTRCPYHFVIVAVTKRKKGINKGCTIPNSQRMPPPRLEDIHSASAREQSGQLTPRTPHSRAGHAEEGFSEFESQHYGDNDHTLEQQREPLLASSTDASYPPSGYRAKGDDDPDIRGTSQGFRGIALWFVANCGLVVGSALAFALLLTAILSYKRPEALLSAVGVSETSPSPSSSPISTQKEDDALPAHPENIISYENYTHFPLDPLEYKEECHKLLGEVMGAMEFWSGEADVVHHDEVKHPAPESLPARDCNKTITYMLDGHVGLLADLALMAQTAGLAREV